MSNPSNPSAERLKFRRPAKYSEKLVEAMCASIRLTGLPDFQAGLLAGAAPEAIVEWQKEKPAFLRRLKCARAEYIRDRLEKIGAAAGRDGALDWRAQVWLLEHAATPPEEDGPAQGSDTPALSPLFQVTPEQLELLQKRRALALEKMNHE